MANESLARKNVRDPLLPRDAEVREQFLSDAVMLAVNTATQLLEDADKAVVLKAVGFILDLEKTRMRHSQHILGVPPKVAREAAKLLGPLESSSVSVPTDDLDDDFLEDTLEDDLDDDFSAPSTESAHSRRGCSSHKSGRSKPAIPAYIPGRKPTVAFTKEPEVPVTPPEDLEPVPEMTDEEIAAEKMEFRAWLRSLHGSDLPHVVDSAPIPIVPRVPELGLRQPEFVMPLRE